MSGELLLINPRKRRAKRRAAPRVTARRANPIRRRRRVAVKRASNPIRRRIHAKVRRVSRRRRNPSFRSSSIMAMLKPALLGGVGSVAVDALMGQVRPMLPASVSSNAYSYAAVKAAITVALGLAGRKVMGSKATDAAIGALTVQSANLITGLITGASSTTSVAGLRGRLGAFTNPNVNAGFQANRSSQIPLSIARSGGNPMPLNGLGAVRPRYGMRR